MIRTLLRASLGIAVTVSLVLGFTAAPQQARAAEYVADGRTVPFATPAIVPVLDSPMGHGTDLPAGEPVRLPAGPDAGSAHSALVRLTVFDATEDLTVAAAGAPALHVTAGDSASTTVLMPVADGQLSLTASAATAARVEVLATFRGVGPAPGATIALPEAVQRGEALTIEAGGAAEFGVTGLGGVPAQDVRAVHVSLSVTAQSPAVVEVDGQQLPVSSGTTVISTVVTPSAGLVSVGASESVEVDLAVRGWVPEAPDYGDGINGPGTYWPEVLQPPAVLPVTDAAPAPLTLDARPDAGHVVALLWATDATDYTMLEAGPHYVGRARGALVAGDAQPQLTLIPADDPVLTLRRGTATARLQVLGSLIGADPVPAVETAVLTVTAPVPGELELEEELMFTFEGTILPGDVTPLRLEVERNGEPFGTGQLAPGGEGITWRHTAAVQRSGDYSYRFILVGRDGSRSETTWDGTITIPGEGDIILQHDLKILGWEDTNATILATGEDFVDFAEHPGVEPGEVMVGGQEEGSPDGLLRRVVALDQFPDRWRATTVHATFEEVFLQVDASVYKAAVDPDAPDPTVTVVEDPGVEESLFDTSYSWEAAEDADVEPLTHESDYRALDDDEMGMVPAARSMMISPMAMPNLPAPKPDLDSGGAKPAPNKKDSASGERSKVFKQNFKFEDKSKNENDPLQYLLSMEGEVSIKFAVGAKLVIETRWTDTWIPLPYPHLQEFQAYVKTTGKATVEGQAQVEGEWKKAYDSKDEFKLNLPNTTFLIGPVPVTISYQVGARMKAQIEISASIDISFEAKAQVEMQFGVHYLNGEFKELEGFKATHEAPSFSDDPPLNLKMAMSAGPGFFAGLKLYDAAGPSVSVGLQAGVGLEASAGGDRGLTVKANVFINGRIRIRFELTVPILNIQLAALTLVDEPYKFLLWEWEWQSEPEPTEEPTDKPTGQPTEEPTEEPTEDPTEEPTEEPTEDPTEEPTEDPSDPSEALALELANAIEITEWYFSDATMQSEQRPVPVTGASFVEGPHFGSSARLDTGRFSYQSQSGNQFDNDTYPVLSSGHGSFFESREPDQQFSSDRGPGAFDVTTLRIDLERPPQACSVQIEYLLGTEELDGDIVAIEWGESTWSVDAGGEVVAPNSLIRQVNSDWNHFSDVVKTEPDTFYNYNLGRAPDWRFIPHTARMETSAQLPAEGNSLYFSVADYGNGQGDTAIAISSITFLPQCMEEDYTTTVWSWGVFID